MTEPPPPAGQPGRQGSFEPRRHAAEWVSLENVQFEFKQADVRPSCEDKIARLAAWLKQQPPLVVGLDVHIDDPQANDNDPALSIRRVHAVREALVAAGVPSERIRIGTFGVRAPLCREATDACLALNRRVEILATRL